MRRLVNLYAIDNALAQVFSLWRAGKLRECVRIEKEGSSVPKGG